MKLENTPLIETNRLILRKFTEQDVEDVFLIYSDEVVNTFLPWFPVKSILEANEYLCNDILSGYRKDIAYHYAITLKSDNRPIGYVHIGNIGQSNDLGYGLRKEFWNTGITTEACKALVGRLRESGFPYITATHDIHNPYSGEVMKNLGMTYRYSFDELCQPKNTMVTFRMFQINLDGIERVYTEYQKMHPYFVEEL